jgi:hypothetical protein
MTTTTSPRYLFTTTEAVRFMALVAIAVFIAGTAVFLVLVRV